MRICLPQTHETERTNTSTIIYNSVEELALLQEEAVVLQDTIKMLS